MCGIFGIVGCNEKLGDVLLKSIKKLEYRGYDSAGIATINNNNILIKKDIGKINEVNNKVDFLDIDGNIGLAHTRWATCGRVTKENSHPHQCCDGKIAVVHNGIIDNFSELKDDLLKKGHKFRSETDTEVIAHLIEEYYHGNIEEATLQALKKIQGSYSLGILCSQEPDKLIGARNESPLIIGKGNGNMMIASDIPAILDKTKEVIYLNDKEIAILTKNDFKVIDFEKNIKNKEVHKIEWSSEDAEKSGYKHFMLKEIFEQPKAISNTINGRLRNGNINLKNEISLNEEQLNKIKKIIIVACGTSWHSGLLGEFMFEELAKIPTEVEYASEFRYRNPIIDDETLVMGISQSGETADTNAALKEAKNRGAKIISICNVLGSTMTRLSDSVIYTKAGPEIGVASTKAFTTQLTALYLISIYLSKIKNTLNGKQIKSMVQNIRKIPLQIESVLDKEKEIEKLADIFYNKKNALYLGRGVNFPIALEGALKLKEVSYIHAEGYPAAEMKHGPIALIDKNMPVVFVAPHDKYTYRKILGNIEEVKARGGVVIAIVTEGDKEITEKADHVISIPKTLYTLSSILSVIPLQLLAYHIADKLGKDIDQPKSLAKVVTVE